MGAIMKDYIQIPTIVKEVEEIHSRNLKSFFENSNICGNKISLDFLRYLYKADRKGFLQVVDELSLRGFRFFTEKPNNILPNHTPEFSSYIIVEENNKYYEKMNLHLLGISGFFQRFNVDSDLFFHKIPLPGFKLINANIDLQELEEMLTNIGFVIEHGNKDQNITMAIKEESISLNDDFTKAPDTEDFLRNTPIHKFFQENKFISFKEFCENKGIRSVLDVSETHIEEYRGQRGVGAGKVQAVIERIAELKSFGYDELVAAYPVADDDVLHFENKYAGEIEIAQLFQENKYTKFREFCQENDVKTVGQIQHRHIEEFSKRPGIGKKKVQDILDLLEQYAQSAEDKIPSRFESGELFEYIQHMKVKTLLKEYGFYTNTDSSMTIADIDGKEIEELESYFDGKMLVDLSIKLRHQKNPKTIAREIPAILKERELKIIELRYNEKLTLEETARHFDLTRERIRQLETKALKKILHHLETSYFPFVIKLLSQSKTLVTRSELMNFIGEENILLIRILENKFSFFTYFEKLDVFFYDDKTNLEVIEEFISELPDVFYIYEYEATLEELLENIGIVDPTLPMIQDLLQKYGFHKYGELFSRNKFHISDVLEHLFRKYITTPLRVDEEGVEKLQTLAKRHLDYELEPNVRAIDARLRDVHNVILVNRSTFQWFESEKFDKSIVAKIDAYLKKRFEEVNVINVEEVFKAFEDELNQINVTNKYHLYSIIKYYLDEDYSIGKGNTLNIFRNDVTKLNVEESLIDAVKKLGGTCTKGDLLEMLRWPLYKIDLAISSSDKLVPWGTNQVKLFEEIGLTNEQKEGLIALADRSLKDGYTTSAILYKELMFDRSLSSLISEKGIDNTAKLAAMIKILKPTLKGHTNFMYEEGCPFTSIEDVVVHHFDYETSRSEMKDFVMEYGYKEVMASNIVVKLLEQEAFIEVDLDRLYPASKFVIPNEVINELKAFLEEKMEGKEYISLSNLKGYKRKLPPIEFRWNPHLMKSILIKQGYRQINKIYKDYRYDKVILVKEDSKIQTFEELVYFVLKEEYEGNMHEVKVYDFLAEKGILRQQDYDHNKELPYEIRSYNNLIHVDELGFVTLR